MDGFVNVSYLCSFFSSSDSKWSKAAVGSPLDHSMNSERYSFHTEEEDNPFVKISLHEEIFVDTIQLIFRRQYTEKILPIKIFVSSCGIFWEEALAIKNFRLRPEINLKRKIKYVKVQKIGFGYLYLSSINIYVPKNIFIKDRIIMPGEVKKLIYVHAGFYGLGGQLAVLASAMGYVGGQSIKRIYAHEGAANFLSYPPEIDPGGSHRDLLENSLSLSVLSRVLGTEEKYRSKKDISLWMPKKYPENEDRDVVFISRDNFVEFINKGEGKFEAFQRLYKRLLPSPRILNEVDALVGTRKLEGKFQDALGVHIRHGNGERYYSRRRKLWGVKPPSAESIKAGVDEAISSCNIKSIVVSSDSYAVEKFFRKEYGDKIEVIFLSGHIQEIGAGCNHLDSVFDGALKRSLVSEEEEKRTAFSEILTLAKCGYLCGGESYFFNAIVGFSSCSEDKIFRIDSSTRYASIPDHFEALCDAGSKVGLEIVEILRDTKFYLDGIFLSENRENSGPGMVKINYFDVELFSGALSDFRAEVLSGRLQESLNNLRLY